jgi:hypothetical protein
LFRLFRLLLGGASRGLFRLLRLLLGGASRGLCNRLGRGQTLQPYSEPKAGRGTGIACFSHAQPENPSYVRSNAGV